MDKLKTIKIINNETEPMVIEKEDKLIAVSIELMNNEYVVAFDIIGEENVHNFDLSEHDYETIGVIACQNQEGEYLDSRKYYIEQLDEMSIEDFKKKYF